MACDKYAVIISNFGNRSDRFLSGYGEDRTLPQLFAAAQRTAGLSGVELVGTWHITDRNVTEIGRLLRDHSLSLVSIIPDHFATRVYGTGAFTAKDAHMCGRAPWPTPRR